MAEEKLSILMVCMGNICRSPMAEAVLRHKLAEVGLRDRVRVDSAGTHGYQDGSPPDHRAVAAAARRGYSLDPIRARRVQARDFERFGLVLAMDTDNLEHLSAICPEPLQGQVRLLMEFAQAHPGIREVPDPYYGAPAGFETVLDLVEDACDGLVRHLRQRLSSA